MSKEIQLFGFTPGLGNAALYAMVGGLNPSTRWVSANTFTATNAIHSNVWATGLIPLTENLDQDSLPTGDYWCDFPATITGAGNYPVKITQGNATNSPSRGTLNVPWLGGAAIDLTAILAAINLLPGGVNNPCYIALVTLVDNVYNVILSVGGQPITSGITVPKIGLIDENGDLVFTNQTLAPIAGFPGAYTFTANSGQVPTAGQSINPQISASLNSVPITFLAKPLTV